MITIGEIQDKLDINLFDKDDPDSFILKCITRQDSLKTNMTRAFASIMEHIEKPGINGELNHWQKSKVDRNIENLTKYIELLFAKLDKEKIIEYCKNHNSIRPINFDEDEFIFIVNSYYVNIVLDILWASDISVSDVINITKGKIDKDNLARKLPDKIKTIKNTIIPYLRNQGDYTEFIVPIQESIDSYKHKIYQGASLLVLVAIEGMVRKLGSELIRSHNLGDSFLNKKYNSLDSFFRNIPWKNDFKIGKDRLMFITGDYEFKDERINYKVDEYILIDLKTRLDFLRRTFKKERDSSLHGEMELIGKTWDLYRNYSALFEVYLTIKYYDDSSTKKLLT